MQYIRQWGNAFSKLVGVWEQLFQLGTMGVKAFDSHMQGVKHIKKYGHARKGAFNNQLCVGDCQWC